MNNAPEMFTVRFAGFALSQLQRLRTIAKQRNLQPLLLEVVRQMMQNLETSPREWGDPYRNFRALQTVRYGKTIMAAGLRITYVVHDTEPIVWITSIRPLFGSPFT